MIPRIYVARMRNPKIRFTHSRSRVGVSYLKRTVRITPPTADPVAASTMVIGRFVVNECATIETAGT